MENKLQLELPLYLWHTGSQACEDHFRATRAIAGSDSGFAVKEFLAHSHRVRVSGLIGTYLNQIHHKRSKIYDSGSRVTNLAVNRGGVLPPDELSCLPAQSTLGDLAALAQQAFDAEVELFSQYASENSYQVPRQVYSQLQCVGQHLVAASTHVVSCGCGVKICCTCWRRRGLSPLRFNELKDSSGVWRCDSCTTVVTNSLPADASTENCHSRPKSLVPDLGRYFVDVLATKSSLEAQFWDQVAGPNQLTTPQAAQQW